MAQKTDSVASRLAGIFDKVADHLAYAGVTLPLPSPAAVAVADAVVAGAGRIVTPPAPSRLTGGFSNIDLNDKNNERVKKVKELATSALKKLNTGLNSRDLYTVKKIRNAKAQVVAGINYEFELLTARRNKADETHKFRVWVKLNPREKPEITEVTP